MASIVQPPQPPRKLGAAERRRSHRVACMTEATLHDESADADAPPTLVHVFNMSRNGYAFRATRHLPHGSVYCLKIGDGPVRLATYVRIVHVCEAPDGTYDFGAEVCREEY